KVHVGRARETAGCLLAVASRQKGQRLRDVCPLCHFSPARYVLRSLNIRKYSILGRKILFITTDQMRLDAIGANGQKIARTPTIDALARDGINYTRCHAQNVV